MEQTTERRRKRKKKKAESILFYIIPFVIINYIIFRLATAQPDFDLTINDCVDDRSVTFSVKMTGPLPVSDFRVLLDDVPVEMTDAGSGTYTATVTKNGTLEVSAGYFNGMVKTQYERISTIDDEPPTVVGHEMNGTFLTVSFADNQCGVDLATAYALDSDGTTLMPIELSEENMSARFQTLSDSLDIHIKDMNGNEGSFLIENLTSMGSSGESRSSSGEGESSGSSGSSARETTKAAETTKARETTAAETTKAKETTKAAETTKAKETTKAAETTRAKETTAAAETTKASVTETAAADPENSPGSSGTSSVSPAASGTSAGSSSGNSPVSSGPVSTTEAAVTPTDSVSPGGSSSGPVSTTAASPAPQTETTAASSGGPGVQGSSAGPSPQPETAAASPVQETSAQSSGPSPDGTSGGGSVATVEAVPGM